MKFQPQAAVAFDLFMEAGAYSFIVSVVGVVFCCVLRVRLPRGAGQGLELDGAG